VNDQDHGQPNLGKELQSSEGDLAPIRSQPPTGRDVGGWALNYDMVVTAAYPQLVSFINHLDVDAVQGFNLHQRLGCRRCPLIDDSRAIAMVHGGFSVPPKSTEIKVMLKRLHIYLLSQCSNDSRGKAFIYPGRVVLVLADSVS
jgi:hypothetical protein